MSENVAHRKIMNCNSSGNHLLKNRCKWKIKLGRDSHCKMVPGNRLTKKCSGEKRDICSERVIIAVWGQGAQKSRNHLQLQVPES